MKLRHILAAAAIAATAVSLTGCAYGQQQRNPYSRICEDSYSQTRVIDGDCLHGGFYHWYYYPSTIIYPGIGGRLVRGGYSRVPSGYSYHSVPSVRPRVAPARTYQQQAAKSNSGYSSKSNSGYKSSGGYKSSSGGGYHSSTGGYHSGGGFK